jgi:hypothetical protein
MPTLLEAEGIKVGEIDVNESDFSDTEFQVGYAIGEIFDEIFKRIKMLSSAMFKEVLKNKSLEIVLSIDCSVVYLCYSSHVIRIVLNNANLVFYCNASLNTWL